MIKVDNVDVYGFRTAIRGMRNPMNSWDKSDSYVSIDYHYCKIGPNDLDLMQRLYKAGPEHRKYLRMIHVSMDILAPLYWWKEFDTYKVGTAVNSCSTMHKLASRDLTLDDFSTEHLYDDERYVLEETIKYINGNRQMYVESKIKDDWWQMIQLLPTSYNQKRTVDFNYETASAMIRQRSGHKLDEWNKFVMVLHALPWLDDIMEGSVK